MPSSGARTSGGAFHPSALINIGGGLSFGIAIGMTAILIFARAAEDDCRRFTPETDCPASCQVNSAAECVFRDAEKLCGGETCRGSGCELVDGVCVPPLGWDTISTGLFASMMTLGGLMGSFVGGRSRPSTRLADLQRLALLYIASTAMTSFAWSARSFPLLCISRIGVGIAVGTFCVVCPLTVAETAPAGKATLFGAFFQIAITFGIAVAALVGYVFQHSPFLGQLMIFVSGVVASTLLLAIKAQPKSAAADVSENAKENKSNGGFASLLQPAATRGIVAGIALSAAQQLTGINAVMNYAPVMTKSVGYAPLTGNLVIMFWNFVTTLMAIPLASKASPKTMYVGALSIAAAACLATSRGIASSSGSLTAWGLALFIAAFEFGMGPMFFVLATEVFPPQLRDAGCGFINVTQFICNLIIALCFPSLVQALGMSAVFAIFGSIGIFCTLLLVFVLP